MRYSNQGRIASVKPSSRYLSPVPWMWFLVLALMFVWFTGESSKITWVAAGIIAVVGTLAAHRLRAIGILSGHLRPRWLGSLPSTIKQIPVDFFILVRELVACVASRKREQGVFVGRKIPAGEAPVTDESWRTFVTVAATWSPNSYVVDIDPVHRSRLAHDLVPNRNSEKPA